MDLRHLREGFRDETQRKRAQNAIHDRLADDRDPDECRYLIRFVWQLEMTYREVTLDELREHVAADKVQIIIDLIDALADSPEQVDQWIASTESAHPLIQDRGFRQLTQLLANPLEDESP
jgi:hypothetical protein